MLTPLALESLVMIHCQGSNDNILACSAGNLNSVLDIAEGIDHVTKWNKKDVFHICQTMPPMIDSNKTFYVLIACDRAANVQKAGTLLEQHLPRCTVLNILEHTASLLFGKVMAVRLMNEMCQFANLVGNVHILMVCDKNLLSLYPCFSASLECIWIHPSCLLCSAQEDIKSSQQWHCFAVHWTIKM